MKIKVSAIQMISKDDIRENIERAEKFIKIAAEKGANIIAFPELFCNKWFPCERNKKNFNLADSKDGLIIREMASLSKKYDVLLAVPFFERYRRRFYNSCAIIDGGKLLGIYRKVHIPNIPLYEETFYFTRGKEFPVFDTRFGKIGVQICWDNFFPEGYRILALKGAKFIITPTASAFKTQKRWKIVIASHALLNNIFVLRVNRVGKEKFQEFYGNSFLVGPDGSFIGETLGYNEGIFISNFDLSDTDRMRKIFTFFDCRQSDLYKDLLL